jgi:hypothetical protein
VAAQRAGRPGVSGEAALVRPAVHSARHSPAGARGSLGLAADATETGVRRAYRRLALECHPDRGGSVEAFRALTESYRAALRVVGGG